jgi:predicted Fe-S protein YdhL (DUF1289 family)
MSKETPCIAICMIDPNSGHCFGCGRMPAEIASLHRFAPSERVAVMAGLPWRMADAELTPPGGAKAN